LLEAAGEEFAAKGYDAASLRTICSKVKANVAAVNYHFGSKEQLYLEAVREAHRCGTELLPESFFAGATPAEQLRRYIRHFLTNVVAISHQQRWHHALLLREMIEPTPASEVLVRESIRPRFERLVAIFRQICPEADDRRLYALGFSVVGQCLHYKVACAITEKLVGREMHTSLMDLDFLSEHIASVCLAAMGLAPPLNAAGESVASHEADAR
jgi:AcrR family transcriptional regulator